jgi:hypothetical protein
MQRERHLLDWGYLVQYPAHQSDPLLSMIRLPRLRSIRALLVSALLAVCTPYAWAVYNNGGYDNTEPTDTDVSHWTTGWNLGSGITGWDYFGTVNGASAVYLGNGWVLTAAHVGSGTFGRNGVTYSMIAGTAHSIQTTVGNTGTADLILFQIANPPNLAALTLSSSSPRALLSKTVMIGGGGGNGETWGYDTVTTTSIGVNVNTFYSIDFEAAYGTPTSNVSHLVSGDSGGPDFIYTSNHWTLAGINEAIDGSNNSYMVDLSYYSTQINAVTAVPEPGLAGWMGAAAASLPLLSRLRKRRRS